MSSLLDFDIRWVTPDNTLKEGSPIHQLMCTFIKQTRQDGMEPNPGIFSGKLG
jgi:hypothetical protein